MPSLIWSPRAAADLQRLYRFLLPKNPDAAQRAVKAIRAGIRRLQLQPHIFSTVDKSKTWPLTGAAISQAALVMPAKAGIQCHPCAREGIGKRQRLPSASRLDTRLRGCDGNQRRLQEMSS